jgi:DNA-binding MarR family transcriptional regulator
MSTDVHAEPNASSIPAADDTAAIAARLRLSATRLARQLRQETSAGLTPSQLSALATIERHGPLTLGALAEHERVAPPSITKLIAKLEAAGLVARELDDKDRRVAWVSTTTAGNRRLATIRQRKNAWLTARLAHLDDDQRRCVAAALDALDELTAERP